MTPPTEGGPITVNSNISANAGGTGTGGYVTISTSGAGNAVTIGSPRISAQGGTSSGDGGNIIVSSPGGLTVSTTKMNVGVESKGNGSGGSIAITAEGSVNFGSAVLNAGSRAASGNGGFVNINSAADISSNAQILVDSSSGKGGTVSIVAGTDLTLFYNHITADGITGGNITLESSTSGSGTLNLGSVVSANSQGQGNSAISISTAPASNGNINLTGRVSANGGTINVSADGSGNIMGSGLLAGETLNLVSGVGSIGSLSQRITTSSAYVAGNTSGSGNVYLEFTKDVTILSSRAGNFFDVEGQHSIRTSDLPNSTTQATVVNIQDSPNNNDGIFVDSTIVALKAVNLNASRGPITFEKGHIEVLDPAGVLSMIGHSIINSFSPNASPVTILAPIVIMTSSNGGIGAPTSPIVLTNPTNNAFGGLQLTASSTRDSYILVNGNVSLASGGGSNGGPILSSSAKGIFSLFTSPIAEERGDISITSFLKASSVIITTGVDPSTLLPIGITNSVVRLGGTISADRSISITTNGLGDIQQTIPTLSLVSPKVVLKTDYGFIGQYPVLVDPSGPIQPPSTNILPLVLSTTELSANTGANLSIPAFGTVNITNVGLKPLVLNDSQAGSTFTIVSSSKLLLNSITAGGNITADSFSSVEVQSGAVVFSAPGSIGIAAASDNLFVHSGANIGAVNGNVYLLALTGNIFLGDKSSTTPTFITAANIGSNQSGAFGNVIIKSFEGNGGLEGASNIGTRLLVTSLPPSPPNPPLVLWSENKVTAAGFGNTATGVNRFVILDAELSLFSIRFNSNVHVQAAGTSAAPSQQSATQIPSFVTDPLFNPISFCEMGAPLDSTWSYAQLGGTGQVLSKTKAVVYEVSNNVFEFDYGESVIVAKRRTILKVKGATVEVLPGSVVMVTVDETAAMIRNLTDEKAHSVKVSFDHVQIVEIAPGQEVAWGQNRIELLKLQNSEAVAKRKQRMRDDLGSITLMTSDISIPSLLNSTRLSDLRFTEMFNQLYKRILKTAVAISITTARHGAYRQ